MEHEDLFESAFKEVETGAFLSDWVPPNAIRTVLQDALRLTGKYRPGLVAVKFRALNGDKRRSLIGTFCLPPCQERMVDSLGVTSAEPVVDELWAAVDDALHHFPAVIVRLSLFSALLGSGATSPGVVEYVAVHHPALRVANDPDLPRPEFADSAEQPAPDLNSPVSIDQRVEEPSHFVEVASESMHGDSNSSDLEAARLRALQAAHELVVRIGEARRPRDSDLEQLTSFIDRFDALAHEAQTAGVPAVPSDPSVPELQALIETATTQPFPSLAELAAMGSERSINGLDEVVAQALRLASLTGPPMPADEATAGALRVLLDVLRDPSKQTEFDPTSVALSLPASWLEVAYAIKFGQVTLLPCLSEVEGTGEDLEVSEPNDTDSVIADEPAEGSATEQSLVEGPTEDPELVPDDGVSEPADPTPVEPDTAFVHVSDRTADSDTNDRAHLGTDSNVESFGAKLLFGGRLAPYYWWATQTEEDQHNTIDFDPGVALAAVLLDGCRSAFDEFAYRASETLADAARKQLKAGTATHAVMACLAIAGAAGTGHDGFSSVLSQLEAQPNTWESSTRSILRRLSDVPLGGVGSSFKAASSEEGALSGPTALELETEWARQFSDSARHRRIKFQPATVVWQELVRPDGPHSVLGGAAAIIATQELGRRAEVFDLVGQLRERDEIEALIDRVARSTPRLHNQTNIDAGARQRLIEYIEEAVQHFGRWVTAVDAADVSAKTKLSASASLGLTETDVNLAITDVLKPIHGSPLSETVRRIAQHALTVGGTPTAASRPTDPVAEWVSWEIDVDAEIPSTELFVADGRRLTDNQLREPDLQFIKHNCKRLLEANELARVERVVTAIGRLHPDLSLELATEVSAARTEMVRQLRRQCDHIETLMGQARAFGLLSDERASDVLTDIEIARMDDGSSVQSLSDQIAQRDIELRTLLAARGEELADRIDELFAAGALDEERRLRLLSRLQADDLRTVEEQLARVDEGGDLGAAAEGLFDVRDFFPAKVQAASSLKAGWDMLEATSKGKSIGPFDMSGLQGDERDAARAAMENWLELLRAERTEAQSADRSPAILRALGIGFEARGIRPGHAPHRRGLLFMDFKGIRRAGRAMVPALGSLLAGSTLRVMFVFDEMTARKLLEVAKQDDSGFTCLIVYLPGVLDAEQRRAAANICRKANLLVPIVDLAVFLELLSSPEADRFERLMHLTLPFTWVNPYVPNVQGRVPAEMFYGRDREVQQVVARTGPSFVYGGRQLGKSALLRRAASAITEREKDAVGIYLDLNEHGVGLFAPPEELWAALADELAKCGVAPAPISRPSFERVAEVVEAWLSELPTRRLLVLLDECDAFLERDFQANYPVTHQLRGLMNRTDRRCKFVLAGLNLVQRFDRGTNHPMAHLAGLSIEVGPLDGRAAFRLVHEPLHVLGVRFEDADLSLVYKILASTNDQASLIQLVCDRLLQRISNGTLGPTSAGPTISADLVQQELGNQELQAEISRRFEWTVSLDARYQVIAYRVALEAREGSPRLTADDLLLLVRLDWPAAFDSMTKEEFGWYLRELSTFGVLRMNAGTWMLRSPNLIELIGLPPEIQGRLQRITEKDPEERLDPTRLRYPTGPNGQPGPLSGDQVARILSRRDPMVILVASRLSGFDAAMQSLEHLASERDLEFVHRNVSSPSEVPKPLKERKDSRLPRLHVVTASQLDTDSYGELVDASALAWSSDVATDDLLVMVAQPGQVALLTRYDDRIMVLRPWDASSLLHRFDRENRAVSDSEIRTILTSTGGWHHLLQPAFQGDGNTSLHFLESLGEPPTSVDDLLEVAGVSDLTGAAGLLQSLSGGQQCSEQDLAELFADEVPSTTLKCLHRVGLLVMGEDGLGLDFVAAAAVNQPS